MNLGLEGRTALITGSSRGIGRAIAIGLAQEGANVVICGRNYNELLALEEKIIGEYNVVVGSYEVDATNPESIEKMFQGVERDIGSIDILVNNIGNLEKSGGFDDLEDDDWIRMYDLGFMSAVRFTRTVLPWLKRSDQARIVNIASIPAHQPGSFNPHYSTTKAALLNLTKHLANNLAKDSILVNAICPSTIMGGGWDTNVKNRANKMGIPVHEAEELMLKEEQAKSPLGKIGQLDDVANLAVFLASDKVKFLTGHCYNVDGGITRSI